MKEYQCGVLVEQYQQEKTEVLGERVDHFQLSITVPTQTFRIMDQTRKQKDSLLGKFFAAVLVV
jgi:hypothetical protein